MPIFTESALEYPLFKEPTEDLERTDAWEEPLGFMVGGMANMRLEYLADQYFDAASVLVQSILERHWEDYRLANPTLFLYRHALELLLKAVLPGSAKKHQLDSLADALVGYVKREFGEDVPQWIVDRLHEIALIDPGSTAFRYSENHDKTANQDLPVDGEFHVEVRYLVRVMDALRRDLSRLLHAGHIRR